MITIMRNPDFTHTQPRQTQSPTLSAWRVGHEQVGNGEDGWFCLDDCCIDPPVVGSWGATGFQVLGGGAYIAISGSMQDTGHAVSGKLGQHLQQLASLGEMATWSCAAVLQCASVGSEMTCKTWMFVSRIWFLVPFFQWPWLRNRLIGGTYHI